MEKVNYFFNLIILKDIFLDSIFFRDRYWVLVQGRGIYSKPAGKGKFTIFNLHSEGPTYRAIKPFFLDRYIILNHKPIKMVRVKKDYTHGSSFDFLTERNKYYYYPQSYSDLITIDDKILAVDEKNFLFIFRKNKQMRKTLLLDISQRKESVTAIEVCKENKFLFVITRDNTWNISRVYVYRTSGVKMLSFCNLSIEKFKYVFALKCYGYFGKSIIFSALTKGLDSILLTFEYNIEENRLFEREDLRKDLAMDAPGKLLDCHNGDLVAVSEDSKLLSFSYKKKI